MSQDNTQSRLDDLLEKTSRTFALTIPLLPQPLRREVGVAYLLFRIADTFEDATEWPTRERGSALGALAELLHDPDDGRARRLADRWTRVPPVRHEGYQRLLADTPFVLSCYRDLRPPARAAVGEHTRRTAEGMAEFTRRADATDGVLRLESLGALTDYCYVVAGIVGEMLTEMFLLDPRLNAVDGSLRSRARRFGEGLQLVNILKDASSDAHEGRIYLPECAPRRDVLALARADLNAAAEYTLALQQGGADDGVVAFNALPVRLARATLDRIEVEGPGTKVPRAELWRIVESTHAAIASGRPAVEIGR